MAVRALLIGLLLVGPPAEAPPSEAMTQAELLEEFRDQATPEAELARDADHLEMLLQLKEHHDVGNRNAEDWIPFSLRRLKTDVARDLAQRIIEGDSSAWWFDKTSDWWVRGGKV